MSSLASPPGGSRPRGGNPFIRDRKLKNMITETTVDTASDATQSDTLDTMEKRTGRLYPRLWRSVPRELGFLLLTLPIATVGFALAMAFFNSGAATLVTFFIGVFLLLGLLYIGRGFGTLELVRLQWAGRPPVTRPRWVQGSGFWGWIKSLLGNGNYWLYALHTSLVNFVVSVVTWTTTVIWLSVSIGGLTQWFWDRFIPRDDRYSGYFTEWVGQIFGGGATTGQNVGPDFRMFDNIVFAVLGVIAVATLPLITHGLVLLHDTIARAMLGRFASDDLRSQVTNLSASRGAAISAEGNALRRLERDIHDGPQQQLVRLQMDLAAAERQLDIDPEAARTLLIEAKGRSREALDELRALSRGFAPPILMDRGLVAALESLAARNAIPVTIASALSPEIELPLEIERNVYFVASELVTNATKHSGATRIDVTLALRQTPEYVGQGLDVTVTDDGRGGAVILPGHGLAGLEERLRGLGGTLHVVSPVGSNTAVTGHVPIQR